MLYVYYKYRGPAIISNQKTGAWFSRDIIFLLAKLYQICDTAHERRVYER